jgi:hypothetical protein
MDDFVPVSPAMPREEDEDAGWGEMSREEARTDDEEEEEEEYEGRTSGGLVDLDAVAREEADVWGEREEADVWGEREEADVWGERED